MSDIKVHTYQVNECVFPSKSNPLTETVCPGTNTSEDIVIPPKPFIEVSSNVKAEMTWGWCAKGAIYFNHNRSTKLAKKQ